MHFDTDGIYTLQYTAEDSCGNTTTEERTVEVVALNTVLFTDGTLIINEKSTDRANNVALHGAVTNEYIPFDPNGATDVDKYIFVNNASRPWDNEISSIQSVKVGSNIEPTYTKFWFASMSNCTEFDLTGLDTKLTENMDSMFSGCGNLRSLDLTMLNTSSVTSMSQTFKDCTQLSSLNLSSFDTSSVTSMSGMFDGCRGLSSLDLSTFNTSSVTNMSNMFMNLKRVWTIYVSNAFVTDQVSSSGNMFAYCSYLTGGAGTAYNSSNPRDKTYAHIDGGTADPGYFTAKA